MHEWPRAGSGGRTRRPPDETTEPCHWASLGIHPLVGALHDTAFRAIRAFQTGIGHVNAGTTGAETRSIYVDRSGRLQRAQIDNQPS